MNRQITLASRPVGYPKESDFNLVEVPMPTPGDGEVLVKTIYLSVDPYMRGRINPAKSYAANVEIDEIMVGSVIAEVIETKHPNFEDWGYRQRRYRVAGIRCRSRRRLAQN